jgi:cell division initiation protein
MEMSPNEMRNQQFSSSFRGFNKAEVDAFKESVASALEEARVEIQRLNQKSEMLSAKYNELKNLEETIKNAMLEAQKNAEQIVVNARKESELIIAETKRQRDKAVDEKYRVLSELESKIRKLEFTKKSFYSKLRSEIETHLQLVDSVMRSETKEERLEDSFPSETDSPSIMGASERPSEQPSVEKQPEWTPERPSEQPAAEKQPEWTQERPSEQPSDERQPEWTQERPSERPSDEQQPELKPERLSEQPADEQKPEWTPEKSPEVNDYQERQEPVVQKPPTENIKDDFKPEDRLDKQPEKPPQKPRSEPPTLDMPDDEIDRVVDHFAAISQEEETVRDGQSQGKDF